jgi:hypothetical protein
MEYTFDKPVDIDGWKVFNNAILKNSNMTDCNNTLNGLCSNKPLDDCIKECKESPDCFYGFHAKTPDGKMICGPVYHHESIKTPPYYRLRNKNSSPLTEYLDTSIFVDSTKFPYPPMYANVLFYADSFIMQTLAGNVVRNNTVPDDSGDDSNAGDSNAGGIIQFLPNKRSREKLENYMLVCNGDELIINVPHTAYILRKNTTDNNLQWIMRWVESANPDNTIKIFSTNKNKPIGDLLNYNEQFYFTYQGEIISFQNDIFSVKNELTEQDYLFKLSPKIEVFYCDKNECLKTTLDKTTHDGNYATIDGKQVGRSPTCWNMCGNFNTQKIDWVYYIILSFLILIMCIIILKLL